MDIVGSVLAHDCSCNAVDAYQSGLYGTPYIPGGDSPAGTDCSGLASWVSNAATERPVFGSGFNTGNEEAAVGERGFQHGTAPDALVIGWNGGHTAVTLPDGTPVSSGEGGGVHIGGAGAYQSADSPITCICRWMARRAKPRRRRRRRRLPFWSMLWSQDRLPRPIRVRSATPQWRMRNQARLEILVICATKYLRNRSHLSVMGITCIQASHILWDKSQCGSGVAALIDFNSIGTRTLFARSRHNSIAQLRRELGSY